MSYQKIAIKQNGVVVGYADKSIDFVGTSNVIYSDSTGRVTVNIVANTLHADNYVIREIPAALNFSDIYFNLAYSSIPGTEMVFLNGVLLTPIDDYTLIGNNLSFTFPIFPDDQVRTTYFY